MRLIKQGLKKLERHDLCSVLFENCEDYSHYIAKDFLVHNSEFKSADRLFVQNKKSERLLVHNTKEKEKGKR
jgi:transposase